MKLQTVFLLLLSFSLGEECNARKKSESATLPNHLEKNYSLSESAEFGRNLAKNIRKCTEYYQAFQKARLDYEKIKDDYKNYDDNYPIRKKLEEAKDLCIYACNAYETCPNISKVISPGAMETCKQAIHGAVAIQNECRDYYTEVCPGVPGYKVGDGTAGDPTRSSKPCGYLMTPLSNGGNEWLWH